MGLLNPANWKAQWISDPTLANPANRPMTPIHCYRSDLAARPDVNMWIVLDLGSVKRMAEIHISTISRSDVAAFRLRQLGEGRYQCQAPVITC
jgi:hypothetical protein